MDVEKGKAIRIGITGHRNLTTEQLQLLRPWVEQAIRNIITYEQKQFGNTNEVIFTSPLAVGADTLFAQVALETFDGKLKVLLPFELEEYIQDFNSETELPVLLELMKHPNVISVETATALALNQRKDLYLEMGKKMAESSDYLLAIWDETNSGKTGGTSDVVAYARSISKNVLVLNPEEKNPWIKWEYLPELADGKYAEFAALRNEPAFAQKIYEHFNMGSVRNRSKYQSLWMRTFNMGLLAAFIMAVTSSFHLNHEWKVALSFLELLLILGITVLIGVERKIGFHRQYRGLREIAEHLRVNHLLFDTGSYPKREEGILNKAKGEQPLVLTFSDKITFLCAKHTVEFTVKKSEISEMVDSQSNYHTKKSIKLRKILHRNEMFSKLFFIAFLLFMVLHISLDFTHGFGAVLTYNKVGEILESLLQFGLKFSPVAIARLEARKFINEWDRQIDQSGRMLLVLNLLQEQLNSAKNNADLELILGELHKSMVSENTDWKRFIEHKNEIIKG